MTIDKEFEALIPPLSNEEFSQLEENCLKEGIRDSLVVWDNGDGFVLIDGHNRYKIAQKHNLPYNHRRMEFPDRDAVKLWIIRNQLGRRNLVSIERIRLTAMSEELVKTEAKKRQGSRSDLGNIPQISAESRDVLAEMAGVSHDTYKKGKAILNSGDKELIRQVRDGETTINRAYQVVKGIDPIKPKTMTQMRKEHLDQAKEEHENFQSQKVVGVSDITKDRENRKKIAEALRANLLNIGKPIENFYTRMTEGEIDMKDFRKELSDKEADQIIEMIAVWRHDLYLISQEVIGN